jgi:hypothetical protein
MSPGQTEQAAEDAYQLKLKTRAVSYEGILDKDTITLECRPPA